MSRAGTIDGWKLARERETIAGTLGLDDLPRLAELGCTVVTIEYSVSGGKSTAGRSALTIKVDGSLRFVCQRCTEPLEYPLALVSELELAASEAEILDATDEVDRVVAGQAMDIATLIEDEVILTLPIAPSHQNCALPAIQSSVIASGPLGAGTRHLSDVREGSFPTLFH
jgi:uncharacterized protein